MPVTTVRAREALDRLAADPRDEGAGDVLEELLQEAPATLGAVMAARVPLPGAIGATRATWKDGIGARVVQPARFFRATSGDDVVCAVQYARQHNLHARAVGAGQSFSDVSETTGVLIDTWGMNRVLPLDFQLRPGSNAGTLFRVEAGMRVEGLNQELAARGLGLPNMGSFDGQTLAGAFSTATHGSGVSLGAMCDLIVSLRLVDGEGAVWQIEPTSGITDPSAFAVAGVRLKQDDTWFYAAIAAMGCLGVITSVVIRAEPAYWLRERRVILPYTTIKAQFHHDLASNRHYEVLINPYAVKGVQRCVATYRNPLEPGDARVTVGGKGHRNPLTQMAMQLGALGELVVVLTRLEPALIKRIINAGMEGLKDDGYVDVSHKILKLGVSAQKAFSAEFAVPVENALMAAERITAIATTFADVHRVVHTSPFSLRFVKGSPAFLAPQSGHDTCMIECPFLVGTVGGHELLDRYEEALYGLGGRPHWGQLNKVSGYAMLARMYPRADDFRAVERILNASGVFHNDFTRRVGLWEPAFMPWT